VHTLTSADLTFASLDAGPRSRGPAARSLPLQAWGCEPSRQPIRRPTALHHARDGERLSRLWRYIFVQMLDDYTSVLHHHGVSAAARMWSAAPKSTGDSRVDAAFAAMAEYLARRDGWTVPSWARLAEREAWPWWFVTDLRGLHPRAGRVIVFVPSPRCLHHQRGARPSMSAGLGRADIRALLDDLSAELAVRGAKAELFLLCTFQRNGLVTRMPA
jgi:hypothetical protein